MEKSLYNILELKKIKGLSASKLHETDYRELVVISDAKSKAFHVSG